jgi:hypothetical protein
VHCGHQQKGVLGVELRSIWVVLSVLVSAKIWNLLGFWVDWFEPVYWLSELPCQTEEQVERFLLH